MSDDSNSYEEVPYESLAYPQTLPGHLAAIGSLFGMDPPALEGARVLEVGCASGGNLVPMAASHPGTFFLGIDSSPRQISMAATHAEALGLGNVAFRAINLADLDASNAGRGFDYILAHGVYSWVPAAVREALMALCARWLSLQGIAFISFNTLPGSRARDALRGMAGYHSRNLTGATTRVAATRGLFSLLQTAFAGRDDGYARMLSGELNEVAGMGDAYLVHEHLEGSNDPCWFHEFISHSRRHGLQFLADAEMQSMSPADIPAAVRQELRTMAGSIEEAEQYHDFIRNRAFRQALVCRDSVALKRAIAPELVQRFHFVSSLAAVPNASGSPQFRDEAGVTLSITDPLARAALIELKAAWPASIGFQSLLERAAHRSGRAPDPAGAAILARSLLTCYAASRAMEFHLWPPAFATDVPAVPVAPASIRYAAARGTRVTNLRHENVVLGEPECALLASLNGTRSLASLAEQNPDAPLWLARFARMALLESWRAVH